MTARVIDPKASYKSNPLSDILSNGTLGGGSLATQSVGPLGGVRGVKPITLSEIQNNTVSPTVNNSLLETILGEQAKLAEASRKNIEAQTQYAKDQAAKIKSQAPFAAGMAGFQAGSSTVPTTSSTGAVMQTIGAGISGAAAGGMVAGPYGALAGGLVGLVSAGIQQFFGLKEARSNRREMDKQNREIKKLNEQARQDMLKQVEFNQKFQIAELGSRDKQNMMVNRQNAIQQKWNVLSDMRGRMNQLVASNENLKNMFINRAR